MPIRPIAPFFGPSGALITPAGQTLTYTPDFEADLVQRGLATYTQQPAIPGRRVPLEVEIPSDGGTGKYSVPLSFQFPDFAPSILPSLVAGSTAAQSGNTVTVSAAGHGIVGSTAKNGFRIYYPGSPSIPAGWYPGFVWVDANTFQFTRAVSTTVSSESVNGGVPNNTTVTVASMTIRAGTIGPKGRVTVRLHKGGDTSSSPKSTQVKLGASTLGFSSLTTSPNINVSSTFFNVDSESSQCGMNVGDGVQNTTAYLGAVDTSQDQPLQLLGVCTGSGNYLVINQAEIEIVGRW